MAEEEQGQPRRQRRSGGMMAVSEVNDHGDVEKGEADGRRKKKSSHIISEDEIQALRKQDTPHPQAPIRGIYIAVAICCVITIIVVPAAYAAAKPGKPNLVGDSDGKNATEVIPTTNAETLSRQMTSSSAQEVTTPPPDGQTTAAAADMTTQAERNSTTTPAMPTTAPAETANK
ncbi:uncharacterized protein [Amphiura filiformis]|uniref:uncharacterized protein n=1 Tax=Amphiura filiformis TaxID=82378 RepID=UPI003B22363A